MTIEITADAIIFDLDGTLISTHHATELAYTQFSLLHQVDPQPVLDFCHGVPTRQVLQKFFPPHLHSQQVADDLERQSAEGFDGIEVLPGSLELLESLPADRWSIFTSGKPFLAHPRMQHLGLPFPPVFVTPDDITKGKPDPEGYIKAAQLMGYEPHNCVVFEDALAGTQAGVLSGATVIGVRSLLTDHQLRSAGAQHTVEDMTQIKVQLESNKLRIFIDN